MTLPDALDLKAALGLRAAFRFGCIHLRLSRQASTRNQIVMANGKIELGSVPLRKGDMLE
jgi:hypothetical protein